MQMSMQMLLHIYRLSVFDFNFWFLDLKTGLHVKLATFLSMLGFLQLIILELGTGMWQTDEGGKLTTSLQAPCNALCGDMRRHALAGMVIYFIVVNCLVNLLFNLLCESKLVVYVVGYFTYLLIYTYIFTYLLRL